MILSGGGAGAQVPPSNHFVVSGGDEDIEVGAPDDGFDGSAVDSWTNLIAWSWIGGSGAIGAVGTIWTGWRAVS